MTDAADSHQDILWRAFPRTRGEFEERFATEEACREFLMQCRWNGKPECGRCGCKKVWPERGGKLFECSDCGHQTSVTSGTLFHGTRKPLKDWFRAIFEVCVHRHGVSSADLQRILGLGSYGTAWHWTHKIRRAMVRKNRDKLDGCAQVDETLVGGKGAQKEIVVVAAEENGRIRMTHAPGNHTQALKVVADREIGEMTAVKTDGNAAYGRKSLGDRPHEPKVQSDAEIKEADYLQHLHWMASLLKRWLLGTHHGGVRAKHLQSYLDEFCFRQNRRRTKGPARLVARCLEGMLTQTPITMRQLINETHECRLFQGASY
jgi:transposase-like protein